MEYIKCIDFFGNNFHFYINNQPKYQNLFGGIMTVLCFLFCLSVFIVYNLDDLNWLNPLTTISEFHSSKKQFLNINKEKIWIPFRIITDKNKYINHKDIMKISPYLIEEKYDYTKKINLTYIDLSIKLCNETSMAKYSESYFIDIPLNESYCIEQDNITSIQDITNHIEIGVYLCNGTNYEENNPKCSKLNKLLETINSSLFFDFYYPVVQFHPTNLKNPISIIYKNYFYRLSAYTYKIEKLYIQEYILSDDINLIRNDANNQSFWGINMLYGDSYSFSGKKDPLNKNELNKIYTLEIYIDQSIIFFTRSYVKLLEMISNIFPICNLILYIFNTFTQYIKISFVKKRLSELIFEKKDIKPKQNLVGGLKNLENNQNIKLENSIQINNYKKSEQIGINRNNNKISQSNILLQEENMINILNKKDILTLNKNAQNESVFKALNILELQKNANKIQKKKRNRHIFPFKYYLLDFIYDKLIYKQLNFNKRILLDLKNKENGIFPSKPYYKINVNDEKVINKIKKDLVGRDSNLYTIDFI